jgi:hypothetical protein
LQVLNGSGKSTLKSNPDEIEKEVLKFGFLDLEGYRVDTTKTEVLSFFVNSQLLKAAHLLDDAHELRFNDGKLSFST